LEKKYLTFSFIFYHSFILDLANIINASINTYPGMDLVLVLTEHVLCYQGKHEHQCLSHAFEPEIYNRGIEKEHCHQVRVQQSFFYLNQAYLCERQKFILYFHKSFLMKTRPENRSMDSTTQLDRNKPEIQARAWDQA